MEIDLKMFLATQPERWHLDEPWIEGGRRYHTDGHALVWENVDTETDSQLTDGDSKRLYPDAYALVTDKLDGVVESDYGPLDIKKVVTEKGITDRDVWLLIGTQRFDHKRLSGVMLLPGAVYALRPKKECLVVRWDRGGAVVMEMAD